MRESGFGTVENVHLIAEALKISFADRFEEKWKEYDTLLLRNKIFIERVKDVGPVSKENIFTSMV